VVIIALGALLWNLRSKGEFPRKAGGQHLAFCFRSNSNQGVAGGPNLRRVDPDSQLR
jgi:hypothetical protein